MTGTWDGRPQNPERDGAHWITDNVAYWEADRKRWLLMVKAKPVSAGWLAAQPWAEYRGPCLTPAEVEARIAEARREALEKAAREAEAHDTQPRIAAEEDASAAACQLGYLTARDQIAAAIRVLKERGDE